MIWFRVLLSTLSLVLFSQLSLASLTAQPRVLFQEKMSPTEQEELWHLSEGADVMPLRWFLNIRSAASNKKGTFLYESLGTKFGVVETDQADYYGVGASQWTSPMKWLGLTLAWSEPSDNFVEMNDISIAAYEKQTTDTGVAQVLGEIDYQGAQGVSDSPFGGQVKVPMVGTNCTLCHSGRMTFGGKNVFVEGAPNMFHARNFFRDMAGSTIAVIAKEETLLAYLEELNSKGLIPETRVFDGESKTLAQQAKEAATYFQDVMFGPKKLGKFVGALFQEVVSDTELDILDIGEEGTFWEKIKGFDDTKKRMLVNQLTKKENSEKVADQLARLLVLSYPNLTYEQVRNTPALWQRMIWFAKTLNTHPKLAQTEEGYGRTDAFGRISNAVARGNYGDYLLPLAAPVSFPPMWGMEYTSLFHFNGNTNSVIMRNIGQSFGLGALVLDDQYTTTSNLYNLNKIEKRIYKIQVPEWNAKVEDHGLSKELDHEEVMKGCNVYIKSCWGCHDSQGQRVGLNKRLIKHNVFSLEKMGTDPNHTVLQATPVVLESGEKVPFRQALFSLTKTIKERYLEIGAKKNDILKPGRLTRTLNDWGNYLTRGMEHFRDPYLGEDLGDTWLKDLFAIGNGTMTDDRFQLIVEELDYMKLIDEEGQKKKYTHGYIAKDLAGVWASAPYLHNGSVPTLWHLISGEKERPEKFIVGCHEYDVEKMGYIWNEDQAEQAGCEITPEHIFDTQYRISQSRFVVNGQRAVKEGHASLLTEDGLFDYDVTYRLPNHLGAPATLTNGNRNTGHNFIVEGDENKRALIKFLKVLRPPEEYSWTSDPWYKIELAIDEAEAQAIHAAGERLTGNQVKCTAL